MMGITIQNFPTVSLEFFTVITLPAALWPWNPLNLLAELCKVKCTLVQTPRLCTGRTAHRESRGIALLFLDYGTRRG